MSNAEVLIVVFSLVALVGGLFCAAVAWKRGSDRSANILNIRNCQQCMRGVQGMRQLSVGMSFTRERLERDMRFPQSIGTGRVLISYETKEKVTPESSDPAIDWSHIWLVPSSAGMPGGRYGHESYAEVTGW